MNAIRCRPHALLAFAALAAGLAAQGTPIGFEETYALAPDRAKAVATLLPGTDDWYYYHCRERLDARDFATVRAVMPAWIQRHGRGPRVVEIENREALLSFGDDPDRTYAFLRDRLGLRFDHQRVVPGERSDLPTQLDPALLSPATLTGRALQRHRETVDGFTNRALPALLASNLDGNRLRSLLTRLARPDVDNLPAMVVRDLDHPQSRGFGSLAVHRELRLAQLEECVRLRPALLQERAFVDAYLRRLQPGADADWRRDPAARAAHLARLWQFAQRLPPAHNSLKAHVLFHWLQHDLTQGAPDKDRFLAYIRLPRRSALAAEGHLLRHQQRPQEYVDGASPFATGLAPIGDDTALLRACLEHFFAREDGYAAYAEFLRDDWLKTVLAETKLLLGQGDMERWYSMLADPAQLERLERRVEIDFAATSRTHYAAAEAVRLDVDVKNVPTLLLKVFAIDSFRYHVEKQREVDATIELDGVVPNHEQTFTYAEPPLRRVRRSFDLPMLREPGTYVVELVGNGISSRAVVHKGGLRHVERTAAAGHLFRVYDEAGAPQPQASIWFGGRDYTANADGEILLPFSTAPGQRVAVLHQGNRSSVATFDHRSETYALTGAVHVERESLVAGRKARLVVRPQLRLGDHPVSLKLLQEATLRLTARDLDGRETRQELRDLQLVDDRELAHDFTVPERLVSLRVALHGKVKNLAGDDVRLHGGDAVFEVNGIDATTATSGLLLLRTADGYALEARGKDGEPKAGLTCQLQLRHRDYTDPVEVALQTDAQGRIRLGELRAIESLAVQSAAGIGGQFELPRAACRLPTALHGLAGETLRLPYQGTAREPSRAEFSLLGVERDEFSRLALADGFLELRGLEPGDYELSLHEGGAVIPVRVTRGARDGAWLVGRERVLEASPPAPLHLRSIEIGERELVVRVANATAGTRVHVTATRFLPAFPLFDDLLGAAPRTAIAADTEPVASTYQSGRQLGDEYRYVLERRFATKYPGNMLPRPSLLLHPWTLEKESWNAAVGLGGGAGGRYGGRASERRRAGGVAKGGPGEGGAADLGRLANLDFLPAAAPVLANLRPDADGRVRIPLADLGHGHVVHVVAIDGDQVVHDTAQRPETPLQPRTRHLREALDGSQHFAEQKRIEFLAAGGEAVLEDARAAQVEVYDSLAGVHRLLTTICQDPDLSAFAFVLDWPRLGDAEKRDLYSRHACHELHFFLHRKDPQFFAAVVRPLLASKLHKTFLDHWLLDDDLRGFLEPWRFAQLNLIERILLAQRLEAEGRRAIARTVAEAVELQPLPPERLDALFHLALRGRQLDEPETTGNVALLRTALRDEQQKPGAEVPPPAAAAPAPDPGRAERRDKKQNDADDRTAAEKQDVAAAEPMDQGRAVDSLELAKEVEQRASHRRLYRAVQPTRLLVERNYWDLTNEATTPDLVAPNRFWRDYATAPAGQPFASAAIVEAGGSFLEAMFALSVLDLPFTPGEHAVTADGDRRRLRAATPLLLVRKEVTRVEPAGDGAPLLVGQNCFRLDDRYRYEDGERRDAYVGDEFLVDVGYGCQVVVTNPTSQKRSVELLLQIPAGALPLRSGFWTRSTTVELQPYATATIEYAFYFPAPGEFAHYPVQATERGRLAASATPRALRVVATPSRIDTSSWEHVSQQGSPAEVMAHLDAANVRRLDLAKVAWRLRDREFFTTLLTRLRARHAFDATLWSYGLLHRDAGATREFLQHADGFVADCGPWLQSPLLSIDAIEHKRYQHLELDPLVHQRAHRLGSRHVIGNADLAQQYRSLMDLLGYRERLDHDDWTAVTYYLLLQDRIDEALATFARIDPDRVRTRLQYDYLAAYTGFFTGDRARARRIAEGYRDHPVLHWRQRFTEVLAHLDEAEGRASPGGADAVPADLAATAPSLELALDGRRATIAYRNLPQCEVRYYELDVEFAFSSQPFANEDGTSAAFVRPNLSEVRDLPAGGRELAFELPERFHQKNVLVEVRGAGLVRSRTYFANALQVRFLESWGQVAVSEPGANTPLPKTYVKVFAKLPNGRVRFHKDGYTDLRGRFDYASVSDDPNQGAVRYAVLVLDDQRGAVIREVAPPTR
ncbi:MAG: hypothetical protein KF830_03440 [Planctomycetes bacterium]|nr:hypothetical protein [Planctomycetota bacterium]